MEDEKFDIYLIKVYFNYLNNGVWQNFTTFSRFYLKFVTEFLAESCSFLWHH